MGRNLIIKRLTSLWTPINEVLLIEIKTNV